MSKEGETDSSDVNNNRKDEPHPYYDEKIVEKESRIRKLFNSLDPNRKGVVYTKDISEACHLPPTTPFKSDVINPEKEIKYDEFKAHVLTKEEELWNIFSAINEKGDHCLKPYELEAALKKSGLNVSRSDIDSLFQLIDTSKSFSFKP
jgi:solute carrier family 25 phosphate transporter 23/24/25/41